MGEAAGEVSWWQKGPAGGRDAPVVGGPELRITGIDSFPVTDSGWRSLFVRVRTDAGIAGWGEVGLMYLSRSVMEALAHLATLVEGWDAFASEPVWQRLWRSGAYPAEGVYASALSAIDIALWDIKGKALGLPAHRLIGGPTRHAVPSYVHIGGPTPQALLESARRATAEGWRFIRWGHGRAIGPGASFGQEGVTEPGAMPRDVASQFELLRGELGDDVELCFDAHTEIDIAEAVELCRAVEPYRPYFVEDPLRSESPEGYRALARHARVPIAAGEHWTGKWRFRTVIDEGLVAYVRPDLCIVGGITEGLKIAHWSEAHGLKVVPHNPLGPISAAACTQLSMSIANLGVMELPLKPATTFAKLVPTQIGWEAGHALATELPGLGIEVDESELDAHAWEPGIWPPILRSFDGACTNW